MWNEFKLCQELKKIANYLELVKMSEDGQDYFKDRRVNVV